MMLGDHRDHHRVPHPARILGLEEQMLEMIERRAVDPPRVEALVEELLVRLDARESHPVEGEQQHEQEGENR